MREDSSSIRLRVSDSLLKELNKYFKNIPVDAIKSKWCGLRPLV